MIRLPIFESRPKDGVAETVHQPRSEGHVLEHTGHVHKSGGAAVGKHPMAKVVSLSQLGEGETGRIVRVVMDDAGCRRRFAELGLAEGMKVTVAGVGATLLLIVGTSRMGMGRHCAEQVKVMRM